MPSAICHRWLVRRPSFGNDVMPLKPPVGRRDGSNVIRREGDDLRLPPKVPFKVPSTIQPSHGTTGTSSNWLSLPVQDVTRGLSRSFSRLCYRANHIRPEPEPLVSGCRTGHPGHHLCARNCGHGEAVMMASSTEGRTGRAVCCHTRLTGGEAF